MTNTFDVGEAGATAGQGWPAVLAMTEDSGASPGAEISLDDQCNCGRNFEARSGGGVGTVIARLARSRNDCGTTRPIAPPRIASARGPPLWAAADAEHDPAADPLLQYVPAFAFDLRLSG